MALKAPAEAQVPAKAGWMKTGEQSDQTAKADHAAYEKRKSEQGKAFRFWIDEGEEARITFVDGTLSEKGYLLPPRFYEHNMMMNGKWGNLYVCPQMTNPDAGDKCPLCESGDNPSLVALFTIIDHREFKSKKDQGKVYKDTPKLLVAKSQSFEQLNKLAQKLGGLAGTTWDVSRAGDKSPNIGNNFFPVSQEKDFAKLQQMYVREFVDPATNAKKKVTVFVPLNYENEIVYRSGDDLRKMGLGKPSTGVSSGFAQPSGTGGTNYDAQL